MSDSSIDNQIATPRSRAQRRRDLEHRLTHDIDCWVATASESGEPYLVPLSFDWDGVAILLATEGASRTGRNLERSGTARIGIGLVRDVTMIDAKVETLAIDALPVDVGDRFAARTGFDPRTYGPSTNWYRLTPVRIQSWREVEELPLRDLMRHGNWLADTGKDGEANDPRTP